MNQSVEDRLAAGRAAHMRHAWHESVEHLRAADAEQPLEADDLVLLAEAAWFSGDPDLGIEIRQRAHAAFLKSGDNCNAADTALLLAQDHFARLEHAIGSGWMSRAERLLDGADECPAHARQLLWVAMASMEQGGDLEGAQMYASMAREIADRLNEASLRALSLQVEGSARVAQGKVKEGMALIDEATVAAISGELDPWTTGVVYCQTISVCRDMNDWRRAGEWTDAAQKWCATTGIDGFPGVCRVHRAEVMDFRGSWADAEREARQACQELARYNLIFSARGYYAIGDVRRRVGDYEGARAAYRNAHDQGIDPEPGMSLLRLAMGDVEAAQASIRRAVSSGGGTAFERIQLLPAAAEIGLAAGDNESVLKAVDELRMLSETYTAPALRGATAYAQGRLELAEGNASEAAATLRRAVDAWHQVGAPYEVARSQAALAEAFRADGDEAGARLEFESAKETFEKLGAIPDARRVDELLGGSGEVATRSGQRVKRTFVFTDIVGSTSLVEALGDEAWQEMIRWHDQSLRACFDRFGGKEVRHTGDGFFIVFDTPTPAIDAAVAVQRTLEEHRKAHGFAPRVRIGLHEAEATERALDYAGKGVHEAARIGALADSSEILASLETVGGSRYPVSAPRTVQVKGVTEPIEIVSIDWR